MDQEFLHELRQPLTAIQNFTRACINELRRHPDASEKVCAWLSSANQQAIRASQMLKEPVAQVLNTGYPPVSADLRRCIDYVLGGLRDQCGIAVAVLNVKSDEEPYLVLGDPVLLEAVFCDLLVAVIDSRPWAGDTNRLACIDICREKNDLVMDIGADAPASGLDGEDHDAGAKGSVCSALATGLSACEAVIKRHGGSLTLYRRPEGMVRVSARLPACR